MRIEKQINLLRTIENRKGEKSLDVNYMMANFKKL